MIKSDTEEKMSTYLIIEALYKLRKITEESHEEYLKYNKQSNKTYSKQLEIIDEIIKNINKIYYL
jgi:uncharacterized protein with HEPN domain